MGLHVIKGYVWQREHGNEHQGWHQYPSDIWKCWNTFGSFRKQGSDGPLSCFLKDGSCDPQAARPAPAPGPLRGRQRPGFGNATWRNSVWGWVHSVIGKSFVGTKKSKKKLFASTLIGMASILVAKPGFLGLGLCCIVSPFTGCSLPLPRCSMSSRLTRSSYVDERLNVLDQQARDLHQNGFQRG